MKFNNRNINIHPNAKIGINVKIGDNTIIYENVVIGDNTIISENCVIGEPTFEYYSNENYCNKVTLIGNNSLIRSFTIIYAGCVLGEKLNTGHHVTIRENTNVGNNCSIGSYNDIQGFCDIGNYCRFQSYVNIGQFSKIGSFVFIYPFTVLTNDPTPPSNELKGVEIDDFCQILSNVVLLPGLKLGNNSLIAASCTVGGIFEEDSFIAGNPAKRIGKLSKMPFFNTKNKRNYPWVYHFERGMPWENIGYDKWDKK